ncbi:hypothetical protein QQ020_09590 [Fulvivirgaceae bacterium BMA12]|uniref:Glycosyltransferase RgtA/B/C/D-like domain-containing protein n=1 Tax=Agaribacillus aureus TaxID=3051825 RepID=A0ABT8L3G9_9BACT|nr:hypothetical protein [Fulvivirgaceae bacterium BMA12]
MTFLDILAYIFNLALLGYITYLIKNKVKAYQLGPYFIPGLVVKVIAGIGVGLVYKYYYLQGDTFSFYQEAVNLANIGYQRPLDYVKILLINEVPQEFAELLSLKYQPRAFFIAKLVSIVNLFTYNNYWLSGIYFSFFSYLGMWYLANMLASKFEQTKYYAAIAFLFFPSVVFWSSGIIKESVVMACLCFIVGFSIPYLTISQKIPYPRIILMALFLWILLKLKYYYVGVLIPVMAANLIVAYLRFNFKFVQRNYYTHLGSWLVVFVLILLFATTIHPNLKGSNFLDSMVATHNEIYEKSDPEDLIAYRKLDPTVSSVLANMPPAIYSGLYRPGLWDASNVFQYWVGFENLILMILTIGALFRLFTNKRFPHKILIFSMVTYILILASFMALSSPNFGTLVRYKIAFLPFFIYLITINNPLVDGAINMIRPKFKAE